ncbi:alanine--tRNA ligase [Striga asiatica]|uniref:Alanine--tRNA ligase n=1 Tax=Striga asiatica TaxID=4170 RepID=A0A5A7PAM7_STRAF|nr:alanine--tRNA ligase [Striga asiatica]
MRVRCLRVWFKHMLKQPEMCQTMEIFADRVEIAESRTCARTRRALLLKVVGELASTRDKGPLSDRTEVSSSFPWSPEMMAAERRGGAARVICAWKRSTTIGKAGLLAVMVMATELVHDKDGLTTLLEDGDGGDRKR